MNNQKTYIQITSGRGPAECCRAVVLVLEKILSEAKQKELKTEMIEQEQGVINRTLFSALLSLQGEKSKEIALAWQGTVQWISQSPYRIHHRRKNWFIGINILSVPEISSVREKDFIYQTLRASGPGGQHVNKTESAVRMIHTPSGISVTASEHRSQHQNKKAVTERMMVKLAAWEKEKTMQEFRQNWQNHNQLERGNPVKIIKEEMKK